MIVIHLQESLANDVCRVELRRADDGVVLMAWQMFRGQSLAFNPPLGREPRGRLQLWVDDKKHGGEFWILEPEGPVTICRESDDE